MKKIVSIVICTIGILSLTSCGSSRPCGLSKTSKKIQQQYNQQEVLVSEVTE